eukprot:c4629_g1_i1.p1 GENE.c4629_g1_i1~~c4629_g1_i1.p1  ORF type:complete len:245 (+),score=54.82 c4629_g1_i1:45-779(+)
MASLDPFPIAKEDVQKSLNETKAYFERWKQLVVLDNPTPDNLEELEWIKTQLTTGIQNIESDANDMQRALGAMQGRVEPNELESRKRFVSETREYVLKLKGEVLNPKWRHQEEARKRDELMHTSAGDKRKKDARSRIEATNQEFIDDQQRQQQLIMEEQDQDLTELGGSVSRLGQVGLAIQDSLKEQESMLRGLEEDMDNTDHRLTGLMGKMKVLLNNKDRGKLCAILVLTIAFILLLAAVIYF